jgi:CRP-like cAMP-binding protein
MMEKDNKAYAIPFLETVGFTFEELQLFYKHMQVVVKQKNEALLQAGEEETQFRFLHKGLARQYYVHEGREINVQFFQPNDIVCAFSSYTAHEPSAYSIKALEPSTFLCFNRAQMDLLISQGLKHTAFGKKLMTHLFLQKEKRERELLNEDGLGRLRHFMTAYPELFEKLPQIYVASYLNIKPETLSTLKKKIQGGG